MMRESQCSYCKHLVRKSREEMLKSWECSAFPAGIPNDLIHSKKIHNAPYPGDSGIMFEQNPKKDYFDIEEFAENMKGEYPK